MNPQIKIRWLQLCEQAASEQNLDEHVDTAREIKRIAEEELRRLREHRAALN